MLKSIIYNLYFKSLYNLYNLYKFIEVSYNSIKSLLRLGRKLSLGPQI